jgi:hypothetical protein
MGKRQRTDTLQKLRQIGHDGGISRIVGHDTGGTVLERRRDGRGGSDDSGHTPGILCSVFFGFVVFKLGAARVDV